MTGTAETEAGEFWTIYKLDVVTIPTNVQVIRKDQQDLVYKTKREKYKAVIDEVEILSGKGRPVLVGTTSVEVSELLSRMLQQKKLNHNVLNAKQHSREAQIVAEAGLPGAITIATNMAGRGTDIKLGAGVKEAGGLAIIGTERHESRRVDRQLRGRAGRQGDPGTSQFFVSLEDDLMRLFGSERIAALMDKMGHKDGEVLQHKMISNSIERAQKKVEENNFGIRKNLLEYDDVMNAQRDVIYKRRAHALFGDRLAIDLDNAIYAVALEFAEQYAQTKDKEAFRVNVMQHLAIEPEISDADMAKGDAEAIGNMLYHHVKDFYHRKMNALRENMLPSLIQLYEQNGDRIDNIAIPFTDGLRGMQLYVPLQEAVTFQAFPITQMLEKNITLALIDDSWKNHLRAMDDLRQSVRMASYEQKDPLLIYKFEAFNLFKKMIHETNQTILAFLLRAGIPIQEAPPQQAVPPPHHTDMSQLSVNKMDDEDDYYTEPDEDPQDVRRIPAQAAPRIGRNDVCPCGSGKKFKNCHGKVL
jgi:preprotein translocase subunit SecA